MVRISDENFEVSCKKGGCLEGGSMCIWGTRGRKGTPQRGQRRNSHVKGQNTWERGDVSSADSQKDASVSSARGLGDLRGLQLQTDG